MPSLPARVTPRIAELLQAGVITITADWFSSGAEMYGRVTQPHPRLGVYPHESYKLDELEISLEKLKVPTLQGSPNSSLPVSATGSPVKRGTAIKVLTRDDPEIGKIPTEVTLPGGVRNILPKASICFRDLQFLNDDQLYARLMSVGRELGADKAVSRISSVPSLLREESTLYKWWQKATYEQRFTLITSSKLVGKCDESEKPTLLSRLTTGRYPFRGYDRKIQEVFGDEEEEEEAESVQGLEIDFDDLSI
jgi:hypothetical protein